LALLLQHIISYIRRNYKMCILYVLASGLMFVTSGCYAVTGVYATHEVVYTSHIPTRRVKRVHHVPCRPVSWCRDPNNYVHHYRSRHHHNKPRYRVIYNKRPKLYKRTVRRHYNNRGNLRRRVIQRRYRR